MLDACLLSLALVLASCTQAPGDNATGSGDAAAEGATASDPALDEPSEEVPPAIAPAATTPDFTGFGPVPFGAEAQALKRALGGSLEEGATESPDACHYLFPQPRPEQGQGTTFMIEGRRFVRVDTDDPATTAPGGGRIGMSVDEVAALYPGLSASPHKYVEGAQSLRVTRDGSDAVLLFEADAQGRVQEWRIGLPPQVDYVERCG
ncbi:lectin [Pseudoxanthomonas daejeonensis]